MIPTTSKPAALAAWVLLVCSACYGGSRYYTRVLDISPSDGAVGVALDAQIWCEFDRRMRASSFDDDSFFVEQGGTRVAGAIRLADDDTVAIFESTDLLLPNTRYEVTIRRRVESRYDRRLRTDVTFSFTTGAAPSTLQLENELLIASFQAHAHLAGRDLDWPELPVDMPRAKLVAQLCRTICDDEARARQLGDCFLAEWRHTIGRGPSPTSATTALMRSY